MNLYDLYNWLKIRHKTLDEISKYGMYICTDRYERRKRKDCYMNSLSNMIYDITDMIFVDKKINRKVRCEMKKILSTKKIEQICKAYKNFIGNPFADSYTVMYLEDKFKMTIEDMRNIYETNRVKNKKITKDNLLKKISEIVNSQRIINEGALLNEIKELLDDNGYTN